jgi:sugar-specific transcriptional regulator TrmB
VPSSAEALREAVREYEREKSKLDRLSSRNTVKRDRAIKKAHTAGMTMREIAKIAGVSHQRVYQVVKGD